MNAVARLRSRFTEQQSDAPIVKGHWRPISVCLDQDTGEYLNVGVMFTHGGKVEVRMLDSFDRIKCLYDNRIDQNDLAHLMYDIEASIIETGADLPEILSDTIRLGAPLFASGESAESVVDEFYEDVVTLGRPRAGAQEYAFRYQSTPKLRSSVFDLMKQRMHMQASRIIQTERFQLPLRNSGHRIEMDVPLLSSTASGTIVSAWYKSPLVVEINLLQASADLNLIRSNSDRQAAAISVLVPNASSGLTDQEFRKHDAATRRQIDRIRATGIQVIEANNTGELADLTVGWWRERCA
ncbi:hypothetical protein [Stutzerimonas xanthomarina]|uniref:DUF3037 domain-containing protein n=2 Tax=Stutzerimonas xanthomarina TaxID=271420 RepID=A0A1M5MQ25_9GAMM|nr:hypothetical protein [Stutzerimonas xanthomarina]MCP9337621.1 hypothetical protein [Stutzerimonas xanthomarina]SEH87270.1 hypothetical protein SAMN05216535_2392 [Stutzerimonas xanthomarina]SHG79510.1 hypothetical protein SAMN02744645_1425 [Stutzerimonas xanthomarina DSM 18231]